MFYITEASSWDGIKKQLVQNPIVSGNCIFVAQVIFTLDDRRVFSIGHPSKITFSNCCTVKHFVFLIGCNNSGCPHVFYLTNEF